jgi:hypothetical protein
MSRSLGKIHENYRKKAGQNEARRSEAKQTRQEEGRKWDELSPEEKLEEVDRKWPFNKTVKYRYAHIGFFIAALVLGSIGLATAKERPALSVFFCIIGVICILFGLDAFVFHAGFGRK